MKKITLSLLLLSSLFGFSQVTLIDPAGDGGFETGATFASNGWLTAQQNGPNKKWYCGTGQEGFTGARAAFIGNNETTVGNNNSERTVHLYRSITIPAGATNIILSFKYKQAVSDFVAATSTYYDYITVATGTDTPLNATAFTTGINHFGPFPNADLPDFTTQTVTLPNSLAGTTTNLVFTFHSDDINPRGFGAIDDVSLIYTEDLSVSDLERNSIQYFPNPVKNSLNLIDNQVIERIEIYNSIGQSVLKQEINEKTGLIDLTPLSGGSYICKIKYSNGSKNLKIIKE